MSGDPITNVPEAARRHEQVYWNADYSPYATSRDEQVARSLQTAPKVHHGSVVHRPGDVLSGSNQTYRVFTPFYRRWSVIAPHPWPVERAGVQVLGESDIEPEAPARSTPPLGEAGAAARLRDFLDRVDEYATSRDDISHPATSQLSADLKFGTISPRRVVDEVGTTSEGREAFVRQLAWRDFHTHALVAFPHGFDASLRAEYDRVEWRRDEDGLAAWKSGHTGYPIVDAGMRELAATGWMHNRLRMITASFLVKDLLVDWRLGERHFRHLLIDGDRMQNAGNWQWVAGTGFDAAPYFRIMNPITQGKRHDPDGLHIRRWIPELRDLQGDAIHEPWLHGAAVQRAGITLGSDYPHPLVDHKEARKRTIEAYERARAG